MTSLLTSLNNNKFGLVVNWFSEPSKNQLITLNKKKLSYICYKLKDKSVKTFIENNLTHTNQTEIQLDGYISAFLEIKDILLVSSDCKINVFNKHYFKTKELIKMQLQYWYIMKFLG